MVDNQHKQIKGYRDLTDEEIALMNEAKALGEQIGTFVDKLQAAGSTDKRWVAIGRTDLQTGIMALVRSVAQPTSF